MNIPYNITLFVHEGAKKNLTREKKGGGQTTGPMMMEEEEKIRINKNNSS